MQGIVGEEQYYRPTYYAQYAMVSCVSYKLLAERLEKYPDDSGIVKAKECLGICQQAWKSWRF